MGLVEPEELEVYETRLDAEGLDRAAAPEAEVLAHVLLHEVGRVEPLVHNVRDAGRTHAHRLHKGLPLGVDDRVVGADVARDELFNHVLAHIRRDGEEMFECLEALDFVRPAGPHAHIGLGEEGEARVAREILGSH